MAITTINNRSVNRSDTASSGQVWTATSATAADFQAASGGVLQVKQVQVTDTASRSGESWAEFDTDFRVVITPTLSTSKILLTLHANVCMTDEFAWLRLIRTVSSSDTAIAIGNAIGSTRHRATLGNIYRKVNNYYVTSQSMTWLDAPATTSEITYKVENWASATMYLNRQVTDGDDANSATAVSTITATELAVGVL